MNEMAGFPFQLETSKLIRVELEELRISYKYPIAETGVVGFIGTGKPLLLLRGLIWMFCQFRFLVDETPIRVHINLEHRDIPYPKDQAMGVYSSIRNVDD